MKLVWANETTEDIERIFNFLYHKSPPAAEKAIEGILEKSKLLAEFPEIGPLMNDDSGRRALFIPFAASSYVLRYYIVNDHILIVRVWHCKELFELRLSSR